MATGNGLQVGPQTCVPGAGSWGGWANLAGSPRVSLRRTQLPSKGLLQGRPPHKAALRIWRCQEAPLESGSQDHWAVSSEDAEGHRECAESSRNIWKHAGHTDTHTHTHTRTFSLGFISSDIYKKPGILNTQVPRILATNTQAPSPGQRAWASVSNTPHGVYISETTSWGWRESTLQVGAVTITRIHYLLERTLVF